MDTKSYACSQDLLDRVENIKCFWVDLTMSGDAGCTTWDVLDPLKDQVTMCLMHDPPSVSIAESITAEAMLMITGQSHE